MILTRAAGASPWTKQPRRLVSRITGLAPGALPVPVAFTPAEGDTPVESDTGSRRLKPAAQIVAKLLSADKQV